MKKRPFFMAFFSAFLMTSLVLPVLVDAGDIPTGITIGKLPLTDPEDDVYEHFSPGDPWGGTPGDFHDELDFKKLNLTGGTLSIDFYGTPQPFTPGKKYEVYISNDSDDSDYEFLVTIQNSEFWLSDAAGRFWNGTSSSWTLSTANFSYLTILQSIVILGITNAIPGIANYRVGGKACTTVGPYFYSDRIGPTGGDGIPSFSGVFLFFSLITILGLLSLLRKREFLH